MRIEFSFLSSIMPILQVPEYDPWRPKVVGVPLELMLSEKIQQALSRTGDKFIERSYVPYSGAGSVAVVLLSDGSMVPGVRVENASFSLTISAIQNAMTTAAMITAPMTTSVLTSAEMSGASKVCAVYCSHPVSEGEADYLLRFPGLDLRRSGEGFFATGDPVQLPDPTEVIEPVRGLPPGLLPDSGIATSRAIAQHAIIPESDFPVGCLIQSDRNQGILGVNVEHPDWNRILCAERNALSSAITFGLGDPKNMYLSAPKDPDASPCGACRQVMVELAQRATVWMDRGQNPAMGEACDQLLPYYFSGHTIQKPNPFSKR